MFSRFVPLKYFIPSSTHRWVPNAVRAKPRRIRARRFQIPPTALVDCSYSTYAGSRPSFPNPTNAVGGLFILSASVDKARLLNAINAVAGPPTLLVDVFIT